MPRAGAEQSDATMRPASIRLPERTNDAGTVAIRDLASAPPGVRGSWCSTGEGGLLDVRERLRKMLHVVECGSWLEEPREAHRAAHVAPKASVRIAAPNR
jgi:hypothetical protein